jgi:vacuolar-type H+-ATPase subunit H
VERPSLPPASPGRSALTSFLAWEEALRASVDDAAAAAKARVGEADGEAERIRREGEERLKRLVLEAQEQAMREAERQARDRISDVRVRTQRWVEQAEEAARDTLDDALDLLCGE